MDRTHGGRSIRRERTCNQHTRVIRYSKHTEYSPNFRKKSLNVKCHMMDRSHTLMNKAMYFRKMYILQNVFFRGIFSEV